MSFIDLYNKQTPRFKEGFVQRLSNKALYYFGFTAMLSIVVDAAMLSDVVVPDVVVFALSQDAAITTNAATDAK